MELFVIPALFAIALKVAIFLRYSESLRRANLNLGLFFIATFLLNLVELFGYQPTYEGNTMMTVLLAYYCAAVFVIHGYINLALDYSQFKWKLSKVRVALNVILALLVVNIIFNRQIIAGVSFTEITLTREAGSMYWLFQTYALGGVVGALALLIIGYKKQKSNLARQRCFVMIFSTFPLVLTTVVIVATMATGSTVTAAFLMPVAISLMLGIIVYAEEKTRLFRLLTFVPYTKERKLHNELLEKVTDCLLVNADPANHKELNLKQVMKEFEGSVVEHVIGYYGGNQKLAAQALGVSEATISRRARALPNRSAARDSGKNQQEKVLQQ